MKLLLMKFTMNTADLIDLPLDWAVAKCEGIEAHIYRETNGKLCFQSRHWSPSTDWSQGGPIIEREGIGTCITYASGDLWQACKDDLEFYGPTLLVAAMRCYVASKLGDTVGIPKEML